jgi:hypothetical protein
LVAVGDDFFDTISGTSRQNMTENGHKRHEHQAFLSPAIAIVKIDASRSRWSGLRPRRRLTVVSAPPIAKGKSDDWGTPLNGGLV